jgi:DNA-binding response OmpR family regulator
MATGVDHDESSLRAERAREVDRRWSGHASFTLMVVAADDTELGALVPALHEVDVEVVAVASGTSALVRCLDIDPDAIVVPAVLDAVPAVDAVRALREVCDVPILVGLRDDDIQMAMPLLDAGASGVMLRPYHPSELLGRLSPWQQQTLRRRRDALVVEVGELRLDSPAFTVHLGSRPVPTTLKEFELLRVLMLNADRVVTLREIHDELWGTGEDAPSLSAIKLHVKKLRTNLGDPDLIRTVRGQGYTISHLR